jgi:hypothetical protein
MAIAGFHAVLVPVAGLLLFLSVAGGKAGDVAGDVADDLTGDAALGSVRLRGGIDANPTLFPGAKPSAFVGLDGAFAVGRERSDGKAGLVGEIERTEYAARHLDPSERYRLVLKAESTAFDGWSLRSSSSIQTVRSATLRSFDAAQSVRAQWTGWTLRPFLAAEAHYTTLNETNAILVDFLPNDQRYGRAVLIPGATMAIGNAEFGASLNLSGTRYAERLDLFGFRRDNERIEPFLFYRYAGDGFSVAASISRFYGNWHDPDFSKVRETLYDVAVSRTVGAWTLDLGARRFAGETTFPISPITISASQFVKLSWAPDQRWTFGALARTLHTAYPDSPFAADMLAYGVTATYALAEDWSVGAELLRINATALNGEPVDGGLISLSLTKRFSRAPNSTSHDAQWAAREPPIARKNSVTSPVAGPSPRMPYQPP